MEGNRIIRRRCGQKNTWECVAARGPGMRLSAISFGPHMPEGQPSPLAVSLTASRGERAAQNSQPVPTEFHEFILPHLSMPKRGPQCKLGSHRLFNLILWVLYTGMQWKCVPIPPDTNGKPAI